MHLRSLIVCLPSVLVLGATATAQGNDCSVATPIGGPVVMAFNSTSNTPSGFNGGGLPCTTSVGNDVFYLWTSILDGDFCISTCNSSFDTVLQVHQGTSCASTCLAWNDDDTTTCPGCAPRSRILLTGVAAGDTFLIQIGGAPGIGGGPGVLIISNCGPTTVCNPANPNISGRSTTLIPSYYTTSGMGAGLHLEATCGPPGQFGFFLVSAGAGSALPIWMGILCLDMPIGRYNANSAANQFPQLNSLGQFDATGNAFLNLAGTSTTGTGFDVPLALPLTPAGQVILPGDVWYFQLWHRDLVPGPLTPSANFSDVYQGNF
jgi:hypothetical protein